jgi:hypothetical protein
MARGGGAIDERDGSGHMAAFAQPTALAVVQQVLYVADALGSSIRALQLRGDLVQTLVGQGPWRFGAKMARARRPACSSAGDRAESRMRRCYGLPIPAMAACARCAWAVVN